jgi:hypothetical protein
MKLNIRREYIVIMSFVVTAISCSQLESIAKLNPSEPPSKLLTSDQIQNINLESQIILPGDLPSDYQFGKPTSIMPDRYKDYPKALYQISVEITGYGSGTANIFLYSNSSDIEKAINPSAKPYDEKNSLNGLGEKSSFLTLSIPYGTGATVLEMSNALFVRCSAVIEIRIITDRKDDVSSYALKLDKRITPLVCNSQA